MARAGNTLNGPLAARKQLTRPMGTQDTKAHQTGAQGTPRARHSFTARPQTFSQHAHHRRAFLRAAHPPYAGACYGAVDTHPPQDA